MTKHQTKFWFLFSSLILFGIISFTAKTAQAAVYFASNPNSTTTVSNPNGAPSYYGSVFLLGTTTSTVPISGSGDLNMDNTSPAMTTCFAHGGTLYVSLLEYTSNAYDDAHFVRTYTLATLTTTPSGDIPWSVGTNHPVAGNFYIVSIFCGTLTPGDSDYTAQAGGSWTSSPGGGTNTGGFAYTLPTYFCMADSAPEADAACSAGGGGGGNPTIDFFFPLNGTTTGQFTNWTVSVHGASTIPPYIYGVAYSATGTPNLASASNDGILQPNINVIQFIPSSILATPNASTTYNAIAFIALPGVGVIATSSQINFTLDGNAPLVSNWFAHLVPPLATSTAFCTAPGDTLNIGQGIAFGFCSIAATFFGNNQPGYQFLGSQWAAFQQVPPFNLIFGVASSVQDAVNQGTSTQQNLSIGLDVGITTSNVSILSSSTLKQLFITAGNGHNIPACNEACAEGKLATIMGWLSNIIYAGTGLTTIAMIL